MFGIPEKTLIIDIVLGLLGALVMTLIVTQIGSWLQEVNRTRKTKKLDK